MGNAIEYIITQVGLFGKCFSANSGGTLKCPAVSHFIQNHIQMNPKQKKNRR